MAGLFIKRTALVLSLALVGWGGFVSWQQYERHERIEKEVAALQAEAEKIREENETFSERIGYFQTDAFREQEAKKKLGLKKRSETVVVIKPAAGTTESAAVLGASELAQNASEHSAERARALSPNYRKWQDLFFAERRDLYSNGF